MIDQAIQAAIRAAVVFNETSGDPAVPYRLSYAGKGNSGASFGVFQNDLHQNQRARDTMQEILRTAAPAGTLVGSIMARLAQPCTQSLLAPYEMIVVNDALASVAGRSATDALDGLTFTGILGDIAQCIAAAGNKTIATGALCGAACWINMTGPPTSMLAWLGGQMMPHIGGNVPAPNCAIVTGGQMNAYLQAEEYFRQYPDHWKHMLDAISAGMAMLSGAAA